jgi:hypothetical protein
MDVDLVGVPNVGYFERGYFGEAMFLFNSYYGDDVPDSLKWVVSGLGGRVVALRYDSRLFKTAVFGFSLWGTPIDDAEYLIRQMMAWFDE